MAWIGLDRIGFTTIESGEIIAQRNGVVRTNRIDCLDGTNVVQSMVARRALQQQLDGAVDCDPQFRAVWTDNADELSRRYAGSALADGANAMKRTGHAGMHMML
jgi:hypothetical protein